VQGGFYGNALQAASSRGHQETVRLLLDKGADASEQDGQYGKAVSAALSDVNQDIIALL
jgi:ankyrin repeat protein